VICSLEHFVRPWVRPEKSKTEKGSKGIGLTLLAIAHTLFLLEKEDVGI
jgi:hypothetical protein